jgi:hypothetical protein
MIFSTTLEPRRAGSSPGRWVRSPVAGKCLADSWLIIAYVVRNCWTLILLRSISCLLRGILDFNCPHQTYYQGKHKSRHLSTQYYPNSSHGTTFDYNNFHRHEASWYYFGRDQNSERWLEQQPKPLNATSKEPKDPSAKKIQLLNFNLFSRSILSLDTSNKLYGFKNSRGRE